MSYRVMEKGRVEYTCRSCGKTKTTKGLKELPTKWVVTGVLGTRPDPEIGPDESQEDAQRRQNERLHELGALFGAHFCSMKEGQKYLRHESVVEQVLKAGVTLALWGQCEVVIDGARMGDMPPEEGYRKGELPPPAEMKEGGSPF
jgi:hypothetical protein